MATLILAAELGIPIDRVMYCDIRFSSEISGEHPIMAEWIPTAEKRLKELFGITVDHAGGVSFYEQFYTRKTKKGTKRIGEIYGFPYVISAWCNRVLKTDVIRAYLKQFGKECEITQFIGIAYDEPMRWERMKAKESRLRKYRSLLVEQKLIEQDAMGICRKFIYSNISTSPCKSLWKVNNKIIIKIENILSN